MLTDIACFLLSVPPLDELTDELADVVERYRYKMISKDRALEILLNDFESVLQNFLDENLILNGLK